jgi:selenocysteine lyase/cysteine desulfurase
MDGQGKVSKSSLDAANLDVADIRRKFPALNHDQVYFDNAGGSQALGSVIDSYVYYYNARWIYMDALMM